MRPGRGGDARRRRGLDGGELEFSEDVEEELDGEAPLPPAPPSL